MLNYIKQPLNHARAVPDGLSRDALWNFGRPIPLGLAKGKTRREMRVLAEEKFYWRRYGGSSQLQVWHQKMVEAGGIEPPSRFKLP
jgi:hypothetical protein